MVKLVRSLVNKFRGVVEGVAGEDVRDKAFDVVLEDPTEQNIHYQKTLVDRTEVRDAALKTTGTNDGFEQTQVLDARRSRKTKDSEGLYQ